MEKTLYLLIKSSKAIKYVLPNELLKELWDRETEPEHWYLGPVGGLVAFIFIIFIKYFKFTAIRLIECVTDVCLSCDGQARTQPCLSSHQGTNETDTPTTKSTLRY